MFPLVTRICSIQNGIHKHLQVHNQELSPAQHFHNNYQTHDLGKPRFSRRPCQSVKLRWFGYIEGSQTIQKTFSQVCSYGRMPSWSLQMHVATGQHFHSNMIGCWRKESTCLRGRLNGKKSTKWQLVQLLRCDRKKFGRLSWGEWGSSMNPILLLLNEMANGTVHWFVACMLPCLREWTGFIYILSNEVFLQSLWIK